MKERLARPSRLDKRGSKHAGERRSPLHTKDRSALLGEHERLGNRAFHAALQREVSPPGDAMEREADRAAELVLRTPHAGLPRDPPPREGGADHVVRAPGQPLDAATRSFMQPRFGRDFSGVRVHSDAAAARSAQAVGAKAYTVGDDIVFGAGRFAPSTGEGRRLLAHELAHVAQRSGRLQREPTLKGAMRIPVQPTEDDAFASFTGATYKYFLREEIQWHNNTIFGHSLDLAVYPSQEQREKLSPVEMAAICASVLETGIGLPMKEDGRSLIEHIADQIETYDLLKSRAFVTHVPFSLVKAQFDEKAFDAYWADVTATYDSKKQMFLLVASANFPTEEPVEDAPEGSRWAKGKKKDIDKLLDEARKQTPRPKDLPDRVVLWHNERDGNWYLNVWAWFDVQGEKKKAVPLKLKPGESTEDLFARVREATLEALQRAEDEERREVARQLAPAWALELERKLKQRLDALRAKEKGATDLPDGMVLVPGDKVHLQIWVQRGDKHVQRNAGAVPLVPAATVDQLVPYVRRLTAILRQYEQTPLEAERPPPEGVEVNLDPNLALEAFPAELYPLDMRGDNVSVTGAKNEFRMQMDYEAVYGGGELKDLYIASKLYSQYIHFFWEVYPVPEGLPLPKGQSKAPEAWDRKWQWLYDAFNPVDEQGHRTRPAVPVSGTPLTKTDGSDSSARVKLPSEPGDYLVRCVTGHAAIGDEKLKRRSSESYYPVRVRPIKEVATESVELRTGAIAGAESELEGIQKLLDRGTLEDNEKQALLARQKSRTAELERLRRKETQTLGQNTAEELAHANETLARTQQLKALLPDILARAKAEGVKPSELITDPDLETLYWLLLTGGRSPEAYEKELKAKIEQLQGVEKRAREFSSELKTSSRYQYNPEAAFVSELTGQVYPLVLMIGEASDIVKAKLIAASEAAGLGAAPEVVYSLIDVTSKQTQKVYHGYSLKSGPQGHREAIDKAFEDFGEDATYGEGLVAVRIPPGAAGANDQNHPGTGVKTYRSKEGILQKVLWALGIIAAIAGVAALVATGVGAPVAAGILGALAATAGAITSLHNISERQRRHTLELDAELVMDIVGIVGVVPAVAGARGAVRTAAGLRTAVVTQRFLQIYSWGEVGATVILVPTKLYQDIERIQNDKELTEDQKKTMIAQARLGAVQSGLMMLGSAAAARAGARRQKGGGEIVDEHDPMLRRQIEALELEGFGEYKTMQKRGWVDASGNWTAKGREVAGLKALAPGVEAPPAKPALSVEAPVVKPVDAAEVPAAKVSASGIPEGGIPISERVKVKGAKVRKEALADPENWYYDTKNGKYRKLTGKQKASAEAEAAKRDDAAMQARARERLVELEAERTKTQGELDDLHKEEGRLTREHNDAVNEKKQASDERRTAKSKEAYDEAKRKGQEATARAEAASKAKEKLPSDDDLRAALAKLDVHIEVEGIKADPKSRARLVCFAGETLVATPAGPRRIDALRVNDLVWAFEFSDRAPRAHRVTQTHLHKARDFVEIEAAGTRVRSTRLHRFWVEDGLGWLPASALRVGMRVRSLDGRPLEVDGIRTHAGEPEPSYNLSVDGPATYFVGAGVLVHNESVDLGLGANYIIYRASNRKNPAFAGLWYIGQTTEVDAKGRPRGEQVRGGEHQENAKKQLAAHEAGKITLSAEDQMFYRFMSDAELEVIVRGIGTKPQADYLEQLNIEIERKLSGEANVMNRREQITRESHRNAVVEAIMNDPAVKAKGYCP